MKWHKVPNMKIYMWRLEMAIGSLPMNQLLVGVARACACDTGYLKVVYLV